jgi:hypothetical protein
VTGKSTDLDSEFDTFNTERTKVRCATCKLPPDLKGWVDTKLAEGASAQSLAQFLTNKGHTISQSAVVNHRTNHVS